MTQWNMRLEKQDFDMLTLTWFYVEFKRNPNKDVNQKA